jgi:hypothetical protein
MEVASCSLHQAYTPTQGRSRRRSHDPSPVSLTRPDSCLHSSEPIRITDTASRLFPEHEFLGLVTGPRSFKTDVLPKDRRYQNSRDVLQDHDMKSRDRRNLRP